MNAGRYFKKWESRHEKIWIWQLFTETDIKHFFLSFIFLLKPSSVFPPTFYTMKTKQSIIYEILARRNGRAN